MRGDGVCQAECNVAECGWDNLDCGCAPKCEVGDYGTCKPDCMVLDCGYDAMPGFLKCADDALRQANRLMQNYFKSSAARYSYESYCKLSTPACGLAMWRASFSTCVPECASAESCINSFGNCESDCSAISGCALCSGLSCYACQSGFVGYFDECRQQCPVSFFLSPVAGVCAPLPDTSTADSPDVYYVASSSEGRKLGSLADPFPSIAHGFSAIHTRHVLIYLLSGVHDITQKSSSAFLLSWRFDNYYKSLQYDSSVQVTMKPLFCSESAAPSCVSTAYATVRFLNLEPATFHFRGQTTIEHIYFDGETPLLEGCAACVYCPAVLVSGGVNLDDRQDVLVEGMYAPQSLCDAFADKSFISVEAKSSLSLSSVVFSGFRQQFNSLILVSDGNLQLVNVIFNNLQVTGAVVLQSDSQLLAELNIAGCSIEFLNNGFEFQPEKALAGFLRISGAMVLSLESSKFEYNIVGKEGNLIYAHNFISLTIADCEFSYNLGRSLYVQSTISIPTDLDSSNQLIYFPIAHLSIKGSTFVGNSAKSIIVVTFQGDIQNVEVEECTFTKNLSLSNGLVSVSSGRSLTTREIAGAERAVLTASSRVKVTFPKSYIKLSAVTLKNCSVYGAGLVSISNLANVDISGLSISNSGDSTPQLTLNDVTLGPYIATGKVYMSRPAAVTDTSLCSSLVHLNEIYGLGFRTSVFHSNFCENGPAGVFASSLNNKSSFSSLTFTENTSKSASTGSVLDITTTSTLEFSGLEVSRNTCLAPVGAGVVRVTSSTVPVHFSDSHFTSNLSPSGGAMTCVGSCTMHLSVFEKNKSTGVSAAGMVYMPLTAAHSLELMEVTFSQNTAPVGGALTITDTLVVPAKTNLHFQSVSFLNNQSERIGSCINILSTVTLSDTSLISKSKFTGNSAAIACVYNTFQSGILTFDDCEFAWNTAQSYAVLYSSNPASTATVASRVILQNSLFEYNTGVMVIGFNNIDAFSEGESRNITFRHNQGRGFLNQWTFWKDSNSHFYNNTTFDTCAAICFLFYSHATITNSTFTDNKSPNVAAALYAGGVSVVTVTNCTFTGNVAGGQGGGMYIDQQASVLVYSSLFERNTVGLQGSVIYFFIGTLAIPQLLENCTFRENRSLSGTISFITANATMRNCDMYNNSATESPGLLVYISDVTVLDSRIHSHSADKGALISAPASSTVRLVHSQFYGAVASERGAGVYLSSSVLEVTRSSFFDLHAATGAALAVYSDSQLSIADSHFFRVHAKSVEGAVVFLSESSGSVTRSDFIDFTNGAIVAEKSQVAVSWCDFRNGTSLEGTAFLCRDCLEVSIADSSCRDLSALSAPCFSLSTTTLVLPYTIRRCVVQANRGSDIGAVFVNSADCLIEDCDFIDNSVGQTANSTGDGGALYLACSEASYCNFTISGSRFLSNRATHNGGAIHWTDSQPRLVDVTFEGNSAAYGADIASFAVKLDAVSRRLYALENIPSGQLSTEKISLALLDHYGQVIATDSSSLADLLPAFPENTSVTGVTRIVAENGTFDFSAYQITCAPGQLTQIKAQTTGIDVAKAEPGVTLKAEVLIDVQMRLCLIGESQISDLCYPCPEGKYSLSPSEGCADCPTGAKCLGQALMVPEPGYWRSSQTSNKFWKCPNEDACLGSSTTLNNLSFVGECESGYFGNMCNGCISGFSRSSRGKCSVCPNRAVNIVRILGIGICTALIIMFIIKMSLISAHRTRSQYSIYLKIFLNYLQLVTVTAAFNLSWPNYVLEVFKVQESAGNVSDQVFSFDCFISSGQTDNQKNVVFLKVVIVACVPLLISVISSAFWALISVIRGSWHYMKYEMVNSMVVLFFIAHPSIVKLMFDVFNCMEIDPGQYWMNSYLNIRCWNTEHSRYAMLVALPSILLWGVLTPSAALFLLVLNRKYLDDLNVRIRFGFLFAGYHNDKYFWEFVILYRKVIIIVFAVFLTNVSIPVQALSVMIVLIVSFILQMKQAPYLTPVLNELEQRGILVAAITIYCGLFFITSGIDYSSQLALFIIIVIANAYFLAYWSVKTCKVGCLLLAQWLPRIKMRICSKGITSITPEKHLISPASHDQSVSVNASKVSAIQYDDSSIDIATPGIQRAPKESRIIGPENTPVHSFDAEQPPEQRPPTSHI